MASSNEFKIYTRKGDKGETSLIGGRRVPKYALRIEAYGTVDELNSVVGMLRDQKESQSFNETLLIIQDRLFITESLLATASKDTTSSFSHLSDDDVIFLENEIDRMNEGLLDLKHFIIPGGHTAISWAHIARTVCRRAERIIIKLAAEESVDELIIRYMNRLSDYFFILARRLSHDMGIAETQWPVNK
jgi:cob(I)alamin adenosyltransferase